MNKTRVYRFFFGNILSIVLIQCLGVSCSARCTHKTHSVELPLHSVPVDPAAVEAMLLDEVIADEGRFEQGRPEQGEVIRRASYSLANDGLFTLTKTVVPAGIETNIVSCKTFDRRLESVDDLDRTGLKLVAVPEDLRPIILGEATDGPPPGLLIVTMLPGGPSYFSALRLKDYLIAVGGQPVPTPAAYREALDDAQPDASLTFTVLRGTQKIDTEVNITEDALSKSGFNIAGLVEYQEKSSLFKLSLLWGLLFRHQTCHHIQGRPVAHPSEEEWGFGLDIIRFIERPDRTRLQLAWLFPITW